MKLRLTLALAILLALLALASAGCGGPAPGLRWAPGDSQKAARAAAADLAQLIDLHGTPPGTPVTRTLVQSAREAAAEAGPPSEPVDVSALAPPSVLDAWATRRAQVEALQRKLSTTYGALERSLSRAPQLIDEIDLDDPRQHLADLAGWFEDVGRSLELARAVEVPEMPAMTERERDAASRVEANLNTTIQSAKAAAARRPTVRETVERVSESADHALGKGLAVLTALGLGAGGLATWVRKVHKGKRQLEDALAVSDQTAQVLVGQIRSVLESPVSAAKVTVAECPTTVGETIKTVLRGQPAAVQAKVREIRKAN